MTTAPAARRRRGGAPPRTLAEAVRGWDEPALAALLQARPDLARPVPADSTQVASRAATRLSVSVALERLDSFHLGVCEALVVLATPGATREPLPVTVAGVRRLLHAPARSVHAALHRLRALALVWGPDSAMQVVRALGELLGPHPSGLGPPLRTALRALARDRVGTVSPEVAALLDVPAPSGGAGHTDEVAALVTGHVGALVHAAHERDPGTTEVLDRLTWGPPTGRLGRVRAELSGADASGPVEQLLALGLLVGVDAHTVVLPREVALHLRGGRLTAGRADQPPPVRSRVRERAVVEATAAGAALEATRRVEQLLDCWGERSPAVLRGGGLGVRDLKTAATTLEVDETQAGFLAELSYAAGLLARADDESYDEVWLPTRAFDDWTEQDMAARWASLARAWLAGDRATALVGTRDERGRPVSPLSPDLHRGGVSDARRAALRVLTEHESAAVESDDLLAQVRWHRPRGSAVRAATAARTLVEAEWLGVSGRGALAAPGRVLLAHGDAAAALRPVLPALVDSVLLQADLTAVAPGPLTQEVARGLSLLASVESRGGATVYRFTPSSVRHALDAGWTGAQVHEFLQRHSRTPVPQPLTFLVDDVARRHGHLRVGAASVYVRAEAPAELDALVADRSLAGLRLRRVTSTVAVSDSPADVLLDRLRATSRAPVLESPGGDLLVSGRPATRRASKQARDPVSTPPPLSAVEATAVSAAVRAGDRAVRARPAGISAPNVRRSGSLDAVAALRDAAQGGASVWLSYLDQAGTLTERVVDPLRVEAGWLTAHDHRSGRRQSFALHRISRVGPA